MTPQAQILIVSPQMSINVLQAYYETPSDKNKNMPRSPRKATDSFVCLHLFWFVFVFAISVILYEIEHSVSATGDVKNRYKVVRNYVGPSCTISAFLWKERHTSEVLTETWSTVLKAWLHSSSSLSPSLSNFLPIPSSLYLNPLLLFCLFCLYIPSTCLCPFRRHGWWLRHGHRGHRRHPYCCLFPAAGGRGCHLLFPQQVRAPHVHCC